MQKLTKVLIFSLFSVGLFAQNGARGYNTERLQLVKNQLDANCVGDPDYCDCIYDNVVSRITFKDLRSQKPEVINQLVAITKSCQEQFSNYNYDPNKTADLVLESSVEMTSRANNTLYDYDSVKVSYQIQNIGLGTSYAPGLFVMVESSKGSNIYYERKIPVEDLDVNERFSGEFYLWGDDVEPGDTLNLNLQAKDALGAISKNIESYSFFSGLKKDKRFSFYDDVSNPSKGIFKVPFEIMNTGSTPLRNPLIEFKLNDGLLVNRQQSWVKAKSNSRFSYIPSKYDNEYKKFEWVLYPGEIVRGEFLFSIPDAFDQEQITLEVSMSDDENWTDSKTKNLFDYKVFKQRVNSQSIASNASIYSAHSEVDEVKQITVPDNSKYAVIIGNQHYQSDDIYDVKFANHDAQVFEKYCVNVLGVPSENIQLVLDGSIGQMNEALRKISNIVEQVKAPQVYFYYAGHGWPSEDQEPLLIPTDISVNQLENAIKLDEVTKLFRRNSNTKMIAFVDACYASESFAKKTRSVVIEINEPLVSGEQILFSAVSQNQEANSHEESHHGVFTYYLLEALKDKGGKITVEDLDQRLRENVTKYVNSKSGLKNQVPYLHIPLEMEQNISKWRIID